MTLRDWRAGELHFLLAALTIAVAALSAVAFLAGRLQVGLERDAHQLLGADLLLTSEQPLDAGWRAIAAGHGLRSADTVSLVSIAASGEGAQMNTHLVALKAVGPAYPLRGSMSLTDGAPGGAPASGTAWVDPAVLAALHLPVGGTLRLGELRLAVTRVIAREPDRGVDNPFLAPRVMIAAGDLGASGLAGEGARALYGLLLAGEPAQVEAARAALQARLDAGQVHGVRLESFESRSSSMRDLYDGARRFLALVGMLSTLLAGLAVAMAARRFLARHVDACAMLRCLGLGSGELTTLFATELLLVGVAGGAAGVACGYAAHLVLVAWLGRWASGVLPAPDWRPALQGLACALVLLAGFALPSILQLRQVSHARLLRRETDPVRPASALAYAGGAVLFTALLCWQAGAPVPGLAAAGGFLLALLAFGVFAWLALAALRRLAPALPPGAWRFALTALRRRPGATVVQIVALALGLTALLVMTIERAELLASWRRAAPADTPTHIVFNIQDDQRAALAGRFAPYAPQMMSVLRARLTEINDKAVTASSYRDRRAREMVERELDFSSAAALPANNIVSAGRWYGAARAGAAEVSVDVDIARLLGVALGDRLAFDVAGQTLHARVTSLRSSAPGAARYNYSFFLIAPSAATGLPMSWDALLKVPPSDTAFTSALVRDYPDLNVIDIGAVMGQYLEIAAQLARAVQFLFLFALAGALLVLYAALAGSHDLRVREAALMRALGATRGQLAQAQWIEYGALGLVAGLLAASAAQLLAWALARWVFDLPWQGAPLAWPLGLGAGVLCALAGATPGLRGVLRQAPLLSLRKA